MLTFRCNETDRFYFKNLDRIDEEELFMKAKSILDKNKDIEFNKYKEIVELNIWSGKYKDTDFELCQDIDYGSFLICKDTSALSQLEKIINED